MPRFVLALLMCCLAPLPSWAQDASDSAAYRALTQTPIGAVPLALSRAHTGQPGGPLAVSARYGIISFADSDYVSAIALGGDAPLGSGRVGFAVGGWLPSCHRRDCAGHFMAELSFSERLVGIALGRESSRATLNIGMNAAAALGTPRETTLFAMSARLPIALAPSDHGLRLVPYVEPGFGGGLVRTNGVSDAGLRAMLGAGVGALGLAKGLAVNAGVHRVFMRDGNWLAGVGFSYSHPR